MTRSARVRRMKSSAGSPVSKYVDVESEAAEMLAEEGAERARLIGDGGDAAARLRAERGGVAAWPRHGLHAAARRGLSTIWLLHDGQATRTARGQRLGNRRAKRAPHCLQVRSIGCQVRVE